MKHPIQLTYNILDHNLRIKAGRFENMANATRYAIDNFDQSLVWFIEDPVGDFVAIVHCETVWVPQNQNQESEAICKSEIL